MTVAQKILNFYFQLDPSIKIPKEFDLIYPFNEEETRQCMEAFYYKYFNDHRKRRLILGINPGRFGAGVTGIPFTDPKILNEQLGIKNNFKQKNELSAIFIYEWIDKYGGPSTFYEQYFISSVFPMGFLRDGINCNYYDDKRLFTAVKPYMVKQLYHQIDIGMHTDKAYTLGKGKNYQFLNKLNEEFKFFDTVVPLPHPRWIMQYRRKRKDEIAEEMLEALRR